jgi:hypothetical protein
MSFRIRNYNYIVKFVYGNNIKAKTIEINSITLKTVKGEKVELKLDSVGTNNQILVYNEKGQFKWEDKEQKSLVEMTTEDQTFNLNDGIQNLTFLNIRQGNIFTLNNNQHFMLKYNIIYKVDDNLIDYYLNFYLNDKIIYSKFLGISITANELSTISDSFLLPDFKINDKITVNLITIDELTNISNVTIFKNSYYEIILI